MTAIVKPRLSCVYSLFFFFFFFLIFKNVVENLTTKRKEGLRYGAVLRDMSTEILNTALP